MDLVQYPDAGTSSGVADMVYDIGDGSNGYYQEIYGNFTNSDAYIHWSNVAAGTYGLAIYNASYWYTQTPGISTDGNGYVFY